MENSTPLIGLLISILGIVSVLSYKFYRDSKKDNTSSGFDKGKLEATTQYLKDELSELNKVIKNIEDDIEKGHMDYDSIQKQIADIRERVARIEGPQ